MFMAYRYPVSGSPVTLPHPTRLNGTVVFAMLNLCSHSFVPSPASQQATTSCFDTPSPDRPFAQARPSNTAGVERPIQLSDQIRLSPSLDQAETRPLRSETPFCAGPRQLAQSCPAAAAGARIDAQTTSGARYRRRLLIICPFLLGLRGFLISGLRPEPPPATRGDPFAPLRGRRAARLGDGCFSARRPLPGSTVILAARGGCTGCPAPKIDKRG